MAKKLNMSELMMKWERWGASARVQAYVVTDAQSPEPVLASIVFKTSVGQNSTEVLVTTYDKNVKTIFEGSVKGYGYDKALAAISGITIGVHTIADAGMRWERQLEMHGYEITRVL